MSGNNTYLSFIQTSTPEELLHELLIELDNLRNNVETIVKELHDDEK